MSRLSARLPLFLTIAGIIGLSVSSWAVSATHGFEGLISRIPPSANALVMIDVKSVINAPLAKRQGWARKLEAAYVERPVYLPPEASKLVLAADLDPANDFLGAWEIAVMATSEPTSMRALARSEGGFIDPIRDTQTAWSPTGAAFVGLDGSTLGVVHPAERQFISRWISFTRANKTPVVSTYLRGLSQSVNPQTPMLFAIDLTDVLSLRNVEDRLNQRVSEGMKVPDMAAAVEAAASVRGAALRVAIGEKCQGQLQVDFEKNVAPLKEFGPKLIVSVLGDLGMRTDNLSKWTSAPGEKSIRMRGDLTEDAMRRLFSIVELPKADLSGDSTTASGGGQEPAESEIRERSMTYFSSVQVLVDDLRRGLKDEGRATSAWTERYARRIDELPVLNVDEELLDYSDKLAETLRVMATSKRQAGIRTGVRRAQVGNNTWGWGYYGGNAYNSTQERSRASREEMADAQFSRVEGWRLIDDATADIRRKMTQKYQVEF